MKKALLVCCSFLFMAAAYAAPYCTTEALWDEDPFSIQGPELYHYVYDYVADMTTKEFSLDLYGELITFTITGDLLADILALRGMAAAIIHERAMQTIEEQGGLEYLQAEYGEKGTEMYMQHVEADCAFRTQHFIDLSIFVLKYSSIIQLIGKRHVRLTGQWIW